MHGLPIPRGAGARRGGHGARAAPPLAGHVARARALRGARLPFVLAPAALEPLGIGADVAREAAAIFCGVSPGSRSSSSTSPAARTCRRTGSSGRCSSRRSPRTCSTSPPTCCSCTAARASRARGPLRAVPPLGAAGAAIATSLCAVVQAALLALAVRGVPRPRGSSRAPDRRDSAPPSLSGSPSACTWGPSRDLRARRVPRGPPRRCRSRAPARHLDREPHVHRGDRLRAAPCAGLGGRAARPGRARRAGLAAFGSGAVFMTLSGASSSSSPGRSPGR